MSTSFKLREPRYDSTIKCIFIGDAGVGKSSIIERYINDTFSTIGNTTVGVDYFVKYVTLNSDIKEYKKQHTVKLQIWDLAGQMNYRNIVRSYYRNAEVIFYVFDKSHRETFHNFERWMDDFKNRLDDIQIVIVGNKSDISHSSVNSDEAIELANKYDAQYYETSAKEDVNIREIFENTVKLVHERNLIRNRNNFSPVDDTKIVVAPPRTSRYNCCSGVVNNSTEIGPWGWLGYRQ
jgi:small GTP-binding protein